MVRCLKSKSVILRVGWIMEIVVTLVRDKWGKTSYEVKGRDTCIHCEKRGRPTSCKHANVTKDITKERFQSTTI